MMEYEQIGIIGRIQVEGYFFELKFMFLVIILIIKFVGVFVIIYLKQSKKFNKDLQSNLDEEQQIFLICYFFYM